MSTPKKTTKGKKYMTADTIAKIDELNGLNLSTKKIADYLNLSQSTVQRYILVIKAIYSGTDYVSCNPLCEKAIRNYCQMLGVEKVPVNLFSEQPEEKPISGQITMNEVMGKVRVVAVANMLNDLAGTLSAAVAQIQMLAKYLDNSTKEELQ